MDIEFTIGFTTLVYRKSSLPQSTALHSQNF